MKKQIIFYITTVIFFGSAIWATLHFGQELEVGKKIVEVSSEQSVIENFFSELSHNIVHPLSLLILQIITILLFSRVLGIIFGKIGQPTVIGEIIAGIVLGPSLIGMFFPEFSNFLFPVDSLKNLQPISQIGLILFMFIIGMELDLSVLQKKAQDAIVISHASIVFPYFLGVLLAYGLYENFTNEHTSFLAFSLFMGISMSITAFPVLARIIQERGLTKTTLGSMIITCAAADDITAWCLLAAVIAIVKAGTAVGAIFTLFFSVAYVLFMLYLVRPFMKKIGDVYVSKENLNKTVVAVVFLILLVSSFLSEIIGIHALFGAFLAGTIMPQNIKFREIFTEKIEDLSLVLFLPLFFVFTGLRTQIGLLNEPKLWLLCALVTLTAIVGKFVGSALAARFVGQSWKNSLIIGALMNTRGLMELVVLNIGYDLGILTPEIFAMMVLMALITTFLTGPMLNLIDFFFGKTKIIVKDHTKFSVLVSFGQPEMGSTLLRVVRQMTKKNEHDSEITAIHITPSSEISYTDALLFEKEGFEPIMQTAQSYGVQLKTIYKAVAEVGREIIRTSKEGKYNMLIMGSAKPLFSDSKVGGIVENIISNSSCQVGVLIAKTQRETGQIMLILDNKQDEFLFDLAERFVHNNESKVVLLDRQRIFSNLSVDFTPDQILSTQDLNDAPLLGSELVLVSLETWKKLSSNLAWLEKSPSILIFKDSEDN